MNGVAGKPVEALDLLVAAPVAKLLCGNRPKAVAAPDSVCPCGRAAGLAGNVRRVYPAIDVAAASGDGDEVVRVLALAGPVDLRDRCLAGLAGVSAGRVRAGIFISISLSSPSQSRLCIMLW